MTRSMTLIASSVLTFHAAAPLSAAAIVEIRADASNQVVSIDPNSPEAAAGFQVGEAVTLEFTFDTSIQDSNGAAGRGLYNDPNATYRLIGNTSGATLEYSPGLRINLINEGALLIGSLANPADPANTPVLSRNIIWENNPTTSIFSDVNDLSQVIADLLVASFDRQRNVPSETTFWDGNGFAVGMFMEAPPKFAAFTLIPSPGAAGLLGLAGLVLVRRRR